MAPSGAPRPKPTAPGGKQLANPWKGKLKSVETLQFDKPYSESAIKADPKLKGKTHKQNWYRVLSVEDAGFATYSDTEAALARECITKGTEVEISWEHTGKPNLRIKSLGPVLPGDDKSTAAKKDAAPEPDNGPGFGPEDREPGQEG